MTWQIYPVQRLAEFQTSWDGLVHQCCDLPFLETAFMLPLLAEFGSGKEILVVNSQGPQWHAAAILAPGRRGSWETFQPSQLPLGAWVGPTEAQTSPHWVEELRGLIQALPGLSLSLGLTQLDSRFHPRAADTPGRRGQDYIETSWVEVTGSFDDYWEQRGKNLKQNTRKQRNKLEAEATQAHLECVTDPVQVAQAMEEYGVLEGAGWKAANGTAVTPGNAQGRFYKKMLENFCALGRGRIYRYKFNDKVVSMDLCINSGSTIVILKTTYDESYKTVSPSTLMRQDEFRALFDEAAFKRIEFYGKVMEWHTRWTDTSRSIYHMTFYRWAWVQTVHRKLSQLRQPKTQAAPESTSAA